MYVVRTFPKAHGLEGSVNECKDEKAVVSFLNALNEALFDFDVYEPRLQNFVKYTDDGWTHSLPKGDS